MTAPNPPSVLFGPWVQPRAAAALPVDDANAQPAHPGAPQQRPPLQLSVSVADTLSATPDPSIPQSIPAPNSTIRLLGPADVVGIDSGEIIRRYPNPDSSGGETTYLACIEFASTDLPWRFTPACAMDGGKPASRLRPWLVLLVVSAQLTIDTGSGWPQIRIPPDQLPALDQSWAWAHVQLDGDGSDPSRGRSRLLCPRQLPPDTALQAVLVPAFLGGVYAADPDPTVRLAAVQRPDANQPAWHDPTDPVTLPVYDHWAFHSGAALDFEALVRGLHPVTPGSVTGFGARQIDVGHPFPGDDPQPAQVIPMGSALVPLGDDVETPAVSAALQTSAGTIAEAIRNGVTAGELPPPLRGAPQTGRTTVEPSGGDWFDDANRDPRRRLAAARGGDWVTANQDELMAQAWTQAGQIRAAAHRLAIARVASAVTDSLYSRHVAPLSLDEHIALTAPAAMRLRIPRPPGATSLPEPSLQTLLAVSPAPDGLASTAFSRLAHTRALVPQRVSDAVVGKALGGAMLGAPEVTVPTPPPTPAATGLPAPVSNLLVDTAAVAATVGQWQTRQTTIRTVTAALAPRFPGVSAATTVVSVPADVARTIWQTAFTPAQAVRLRIGSMLTTPTGTKASTDQLQPVLPTPQVGQALALGMIERDPSWLVAGGSGFPDECATLLRPDQAFIESALLGANHALLDKYLWRGFPTDRRGTPIQYFWPGQQPDILPIDQWPTGSSLGSHAPIVTHAPGNPAGSQPALTFLMIRSVLFQRYPDTIVAAAHAVVSGTTITPDPSALIPPSMPMIALDAHTRLIGFPIPATSISSPAPTPATPGCFFILLEPPTGLRFGFESRWPHLDPNGFLDVLSGPGPTFADSAAFASQAVRHTVRAIMHSSRMVGAHS